MKRCILTIKIVVTIFTLVVSISAYSQKIGGEISRAIPLVKKLYMANIANGGDSQSYGPLTICNNYETPESANEYGTYTLEMVWQYQNTYDNKTGAIPVTLQIFHKEEGDYCSVTMKISDNETLVYRGYEQEQY